MPVVTIVEIARRATEIRQQTGIEWGRDLENWIQAEAELEKGLVLIPTNGAGEIAYYSDLADTFWLFGMTLSKLFFETNGWEPHTVIDSSSLFTKRDY